MKSTLKSSPERVLIGVAPSRTANPFGAESDHASQL